MLSRVYHQRDGRLLARLAAPVAGSQLAQLVISTAILALIGALGATHLAAAGLALVLFNQIRTMCTGLVTVSGNQIAAAAARVEQGDEPYDYACVHAVVRASFVSATLVAVPGMAVLVALGWALRWFGQDAAVQALAWQMLLAAAPGLLPCLWFQVLRQYAIAMLRPVGLLLVTAGSALITPVVAAGLIFGWAALPRLGIVGAGVAMSLGYAGTLAAFWAIVRRDPRLTQAWPARLWPAPLAAIRGQVRLGLPLALAYGAEAGLFSVLALVMGSMGYAVLAAHNIVYQVVYIAFQIAIGLSHGVSVLVSKAVADNGYARARGLAWTALTQAALVTAVLGACYIAAPGWVLWPFLGTADAETVRLARLLLLIAVVLQFFDAAQNIGAGLLRGLKDTDAALVFALAGYWMVGLPVALLLAYPAGLGAAGVWWGLTAGLAATAALMLRRYFAALHAFGARSLAVP